MVWKLAGHCASVPVATVDVAAAAAVTAPPLATEGGLPS
jgi:hypothetical protein